MRVFGPIVEPSPRLLAVLISDFAHRGFVGRELVGDVRLGTAIPLHRFAQKLQRCLAITAFRDVRLKHLALVIDRAPKIVKLPVDTDENLIQMPGPVRVEAVFDPPFADRFSEEWTEPVPPKAYRLMRYVDAALVEQILDVAKREREPDIHHHRKADDLWRSFEILERVTHHTRL